MGGGQRLRHHDAQKEARRAAGREEAKYRRLLQQYPNCPLADLAWLLPPELVEQE